MTETKELTQTMEARKPYLNPAIIHELELETRAGSPLGLPDPIGEDFTVP
jgi:hypothetical protein